MDVTIILKTLLILRSLESNIEQKLIFLTYLVNIEHLFVKSVQSPFREDSHQI